MKENHYLVSDYLQDYFLTAKSYLREGNSLNNLRFVLINFALERYRY